MNKINNFSINESDLATTASSRQYAINGEKDAEFILQVFDTPSGSSDPVAFYDFATKSFSTTFTSTSNLKVKMKSTTFNSNINFPANASGDTYTILLLTPLDKDTEIDFGQGKNSYSTTITQLSSPANLTFTTVSGTSDAYGTPPTVVSTVSATSTAVVTKAVNWTLTNSETEANGFGFRLTRQPIDTDWYFQPTLTYTVVDAVAPSDVNSGFLVTVDDVTDLCAGMHVTAVSGGSLVAATITVINIDAKTLKLSAAQTFAAARTLTFQARGSSVIKNAIGVDINFSEFNSGTTSTTAGPTPFTKTVRTTVSGDAAARKIIALTDTYGLHGGAHLTFGGLNVVNTAANTIASVAIDVTGGGLDNDGTMTVLVSQSTDLVAGTTLSFKPINATERLGTQVEINNTISITTHPTTARIIYLNLDNFITLGAAS